MKAAKQEYADAQFNLGCLFANGQGVDQNFHGALKWFRLAASQGHADAKAAVVKAQANLKNSPASKSENSQPQTDACAYCGASGKGVNLNSCSRCKAAKYCGKACQAQHWKVHKTTCKAVK